MTATVGERQMTYDQWKTDSGYAERSPEEENEGRDCPICNGDCAGANPPVYNCPNVGGRWTAHPRGNQMSAEPKLKPCPFCGAEAVQKPYSETLTGMQRIQCQGCFVATAWYSTSHGADPSEVWNARFPATTA